MSSGVTECWGANDLRQIGSDLATRPAEFAPIRVDVRIGRANSAPLAIGRSHVCAYSGGGPTGGIACWGNNAHGQTGQPLTMAMVNTPTAVAGPELSGVVQVVAGESSTCALLADRRVLCWGGNASGQLGRGTVADTSDPTPQPVLMLPDAQRLVASLDGVCALRTDQTVWCWGAAALLGDGSSSPRGTPGPVPGLTGVSEIVGAGPFCAIMGNNRADVRCWGPNPGDGTAYSATPVAVQW